MHDSLDLDALKKQIEQSKTQTDRYNRWLLYIRIGLVVLMVGTLGLVFLVDTFPFMDIQVLNVMIVILVVALVVHTVYPAVVAWRNLRQYSARIIAYAPPFVHRPSTYTVIWELRGFLWMCAVVVIVLIGHDYILNAPLIAIFLYILPIIVYLLNQRVMLWISKGGLPRINAAFKILPFSHRLQYFRVGVAYQNQDFVQMEAIVRKLLTTCTDYAFPNVMLELIVLGECLIHLERLEEVVPILEAAIKISPTASLSYVSLGEWYLDQEVDAERAVELLDIALANTLPKHTVLYAAQHAISAQALALTGHTIRARASIETALAALAKMPASTASQVNRRIGYAHKGLGEIEVARTHFNRAIELNPNGLSGKLARQALESLPVAT